MKDMDTETAPSDGHGKISPSSAVKSEPRIDCSEDGSVYHLLDHSDSTTTQQDVEVESTASGVYGAIEDHQSYQQSTKVPIKQEPSNADWKYPTTACSSTQAEDEQIPVVYGNISYTGDEIKLQQINIPGTEMNMTTGEITPSLDQVESVKCEAREIQYPSPDINIPRPPFPVALFRHQAEEMSITGKDDSGVGNLECPLSVETDCFGKKTFKCFVCDYRSASNSQQVLHMRTHTGEKPFKCSLCDYRSVSNGHLGRHMKTHTGEKPFKCSVCEFRSASRNYLVIHMRTHTGEKPFKCSLCDYRAARNSLIVIHKRIHTQEKPFKCSVCDYECAQNSALSTHMRTHTGEKPFKCSLCDYRGAQKVLLVGHMRKHIQ